MSDTMDIDRMTLVSAALAHVPFDGWSEATITAVCADLGLERAELRALAPRGAVDLAATFHRNGDEVLNGALEAPEMEGLRYSEKVAALVRKRIEHVTPHREAVRRGVTLFALPGNAPEGARLIWGTADAIWRALGDTSDDFNWYSKRAILSGVYSSTILFWLGDESESAEATWAFLDRRIENVMQFEKTKAKLRENPLARVAFAGPKAILDRISAPTKNGGPAFTLPGRPFRR